MINESAREYAEPEQASTTWVVKEQDAVTGETTAEFGYATEHAAWSAYFLLTTPKDAK